MDVFEVQIEKMITVESNKDSTLSITLSFANGDAHRVSLLCKDSKVSKQELAYMLRTLAMDLGRSS